MPKSDTDSAASTSAAGPQHRFYGHALAIGPPESPRPNAEAETARLRRNSAKTSADSDEKMEAERQRLTAEIEAATRRGWSSTVGGGLALTAFILSVVGVAVWRLAVTHQELHSHNSCGMTMMWRQIHFVPVHVAASDDAVPPHYSLVQYWEGSLALLDTQPLEHRLAVLFVPGSGGSSSQVGPLVLPRDEHPAGFEIRSLGTVLQNKTESRRLRYIVDVYAVEFGSEPSALSGRFLIRQLDFVRRAIVQIRRIYARSPRPVPIVLCGHSLGGFLLRALLSHIDYANLNIPLIVTLASPLSAPPIAVDSYTHHLYGVADKAWRDHRTNGEATRLPAVLSWTGGLRDPLVPDRLGSVPGAVHASLQQVDRVQTETDHLCILWCNEAVTLLSRLVLSLAANTTTAGNVAAAAHLLVKQHAHVESRRPDTQWHWDKQQQQQQTATAASNVSSLLQMEEGGALAQLSPSSRSTRLTDAIDRYGGGGDKEPFLLITSSSAIAVRSTRDSTPTELQSADSHGWLRGVWHWRLFSAKNLKDSYLHLLDDRPATAFLLPAHVSARVRLSLASVSKPVRLRLDVGKRLAVVRLQVDTPGLVVVVRLKRTSLCDASSSTASSPVRLLFLHSDGSARQLGERHSAKDWSLRLAHWRQSKLQGRLYVLTDPSCAFDLEIDVNQGLTLYGALAGHAVTHSPVILLLALLSLHTASIVLARQWAHAIQLLIVLVVSISACWSSRLLPLDEWLSLTVLLYTSVTLIAATAAVARVVPPIRQFLTRTWPNAEIYWLSTAATVTFISPWAGVTAACLPLALKARHPLLFCITVYLGILSASLAVADVWFLGGSLYPPGLVRAVGQNTFKFGALLEPSSRQALLHLLAFVASAARAEGNDSGASKRKSRRWWGAVTASALFWPSLALLHGQVPVDVLQHQVQLLVVAHSLADWHAPVLKSKWD